MPIVIKEQEDAPTKRQASVLKEIRRVQKDFSGYTPTYREIASGLGLKSATSAANAIRELLRKGLLKRGPGRHLVPCEEKK